MQFNLKMNENNKLLTNIIRSSETKLRVLKLRGKILLALLSLSSLAAGSSCREVCGWRGVRRRGMSYACERSVIRNDLVFIFQP